MFDAVLDCALFCGFKVDKVDEKNFVVVFSREKNMVTWGEKITVKLDITSNGRTAMTAISRSNLGTEIGAREQNQENVERFVNVLDSLLK